MVCAVAEMFFFARSEVAWPNSFLKASARSGAMNVAARLIDDVGSAGVNVAVASAAAVAMRTTSAESRVKVWSVRVHWV